MKKLALTVFGLFLVASSFANVKGQEINKTQTQKATTQTVHKTSTLVNQINKVMALTTKKADGGPVPVVQGCVTKCQDDL